MNEVMAGGYNSAPVREGDAVHRRMGPWSTNVHALLDHLRRRGFTQAPRFLGADRTTERLGYVGGRAGTYPLSEVQRSEEALRNVARAIRTFHDVAADFTAPEPAAWQSRATVPVPADCIGHNDLGPYNVVYDGAQVAAIIDWDFAGPSSRAWDLCYAAHRFAPLSAPRSTLAFGWDRVPDQGSRLHAFARAYGPDLVDPAELLDLLIVRLGSIAAHIEAGIRAGDPAFDRQRDERHCDGYREDMHYILDRRDDWLAARPGRP